MSFFLIAGFHRTFQVAQVVQTVKNTDYINTVSDRFLNKIFNNIIGIMTVSKDVLSSEKHLQLGILKSCS